MARILVIEDEENLRFSIARAFGRAGHEVEQAPSTPVALQGALEGAFDALITDIHLGADNGIDLVERLREDGYDGVVIVITAYGAVESAVRAMKLGADDYLQKPLSLEELTLQVERLLEARGDRRRLRLLERLQQAPAAGAGLVGESSAWLDAVAMADRLAAAPMPAVIDGRLDGPLPTVLLMGETGAGKGALAKRIHERASGEGAPPLVHVNCSALPATLIESELFGHEKGAFTDAREAREGLFEMAAGGTIFLDEIGEMAPELQARLLTVLEEGAFRRVGGSRVRLAPVRVIAATNQDLEGRVGSGAFRRDLLYRLNALTIHIPPLRERADDAVLLAEGSLADHGRRLGRPGLRATEAAREAIRRHAWPGNVREVINATQRAAMLAPTEDVGPEDLGLTARSAGAGHTGLKAGQWHAAPGALVFDFEHGPHTHEEVERQLLIQALERSDGNISRAARLIGMQRSSFRYRIERFGLEDKVREIARR